MQCGVSPAIRAKRPSHSTVLLSANLRSACQQMALLAHPSAFILPATPSAPARSGVAALPCSCAGAIIPGSTLIGVRCDEEGIVRVDVGPAWDACLHVDRPEYLAAGR